jgi:hypothetical protein
VLDWTGCRSSDPGLPVTFHDPFGRSALPPDFSREHRIQLIGEAAQALLQGRLPSPAARLFIGGALDAWLQQGGRLGALERDFLKVSAPARSTLTPARVHARICSARRATGDGEEATMDPSKSDPESPE